MVNIWVALGTVVIVALIAVFAGTVVGYVVGRDRGAREEAAKWGIQVQGGHPYYPKEQ